MEGLPIACEIPILNKQVHSFIAKLSPFGKNLMEQNQVDRTVENVWAF